MDRSDIRMLIECLPFVYNTNEILECILDNSNVFNDDEDLKKKLSKIVYNFGECILFEDGSYIDTVKYKGRL